MNRRVQSKGDLGIILEVRQDIALVQWDKPRLINGRAHERTWLHLDCLDDVESLERGHILQLL